MGGFPIASHLTKAPTDGTTQTLASVFAGFMAALAVFTATTALRQTAHSWSRSRCIGVYIAMIWGQWLANNAYAVVGYLYLMGALAPGFWLWFGILCCWVLQTQLIVQVMCNRISRPCPLLRCSWLPSFGFAGSADGGPRRTGREGLADSCVTKS